MACVSQISYSPLAGEHLVMPARHTLSLRLPVKNIPISTRMMVVKKVEQPTIPCAGGGSGGAGVGRGSGGLGGDDWNEGEDPSSSGDGFGAIGAFLSGWRSRVAADPQFPLKVLMEEIVGINACVLGDMASRRLNELDFVFSTLVVGSIMSFSLMNLLAPTMTGSAPSTLPFMFDPGAYSLLNRLGTFACKGTVFAAVGFAAGLVATALSNGLIKKMDPGFGFEPPNKPPPTVLNALIWAIHMGVSSNLRYQSLNGIEFLLAKGLPPFAFKMSGVALRLVNNLLGGMSFLMLARMMGSQGTLSGERDEKNKMKKKKIRRLDVKLRWLSDEILPGHALLHAYSSQLLASFSFLTERNVK